MASSNSFSPAAKPAASSSQPQPQPTPSSVQPPFSFVSQPPLINYTSVSYHPNQDHHPDHFARDPYPQPPVPMASIQRQQSPSHPGPPVIPATVTRPRSAINPTSFTARRPARPITKCDRCRSRKSKCDSGQPCEACQKSKVDCQYTDGRPTKGIPEGSVPNAAYPHLSNQLISSAASLKEDRQNLMVKIDKLQRLLNDVTARQAIQAYELNFSLQNRNPSCDTGFGIDLEADNLVTHFSKLWLRKEPDQSFFKATHPALVQLRQHQIPRWKQSTRWTSWSDYQAQSRYQQLTRFDPSILPDENECRDLFRRFLLSCDWYFEVLTEAEMNVAEAEVHHYRSLGLCPTSPEQWTRVALALAVCRLTLACLDWAGTDESEQLSRKRCERILKWCDLSVMALQRADIDQNPTVEAMRVLIILTSTIFFETDYGLMGSSPQMLKLHEVAVDVSERLTLHRDPPSQLSSKEKDDRRRMWWALVTIDSHFYSTGATSHSVLSLRSSDTKLPLPRQVYASHTFPDDRTAPLDLRSARSRFELGKFNNRCCQLLAQRKPLATLSDIWKLDQDLVALEASVPPEQRLASDLDLSVIFQRPLRPAGPIDEALRNGQQIFYIGFWHIRSKIHRGLLYTKQTSADSIRSAINLDSHREIVRRCSYCLLHLYRHTKLPTAFISAIASAALTLSLELIDQPSQPYSFEIRTIIIECFSRLQTNSSPIIGRACQVLEYFLDPSQPRVGIPKTYEGALTEWQELETQDQSFNWQPDDPTRESRFEWFPPPAAAGQRDTTLSLSANPAFPADARDLCYPTKPSSDMAGESHGTPMLDSCYPLNPSPEQSSEIHSTPVLGLCYPLKPSHEQTADVQGLDFCYPLQQRVEQTSDAHGNPVLNWTCPPFS
ncbi:hypothetical protein PCANC_03527 [Puccinia coronata f. sp. avenae]|uniref:Zn(2)-C6 fungal-type domain-containing protein n=1 Tax=Puccinia coronata f. sp. avenae TaxID=200324 RepID=A0A2N5W099_9BASI|nr:hypothetical protein PCASD_03914 [Puccinia coronata f. sp. avenae]PLW55630.1 hypothetical protein PCANC_03527 [Puccinia coronata f. sp. avenae]